MSCRNLTSVTIPDSVTSICRGAFSGCSNLASVTIPDSVTYLDAAVFVNCTALQSVKIPDGVDFIQPDTFNNCTALTSVTIPDSVTFIGQYAFSGCSGLTSVKIPNGVFGIREHAFHGCTSLTSVTIPSGLASINEWTFSNCVRLAKVTIPKSVTSIGVDAFSNCDSLTDVYYAGTAADWAKISISEGNEDLTSAALRCAPASLPAPTVTGGNDAQGRPTLKWNAVSGAAKYEVYRARSKDGTYSKYSTTTGTAYTNSSYLTSGATYYYKVRALDANGNAGPYSAVVSVTCRLKLTAPTVTGSTDSQGRPTLKWNAVTGAAKYEVYRARSKDGDYIKYSTVTGTSYTNTSYLENGNTYYYKVRALGSDGTAGPDSTPVSVTYKAPFGAPLVTGSKDSQGRPALKWDKVTDAAKYEVYRARSKNGTYSLMSTQSATGYTNTSYLANGTTYYYKVRALKANGTASAYSSVVTITYGTVPTPAAPAMRSAKADSAGITVSWDTAANAVAYNVYRTADAGSSWTQVASSVKGSSYKDTTVQKGVKYGYKVRGVAADGKTLGPMSSTGVTAKVTAASTTPDYVKLKSAKSDPGNGILLTWESAADAKTYNVYRKVDGASGWTPLASSVSGTSYRDTSGKRGTTYVYTVRGVAADGKTLSRTYNTDGLRATVR